MSRRPSPSLSVCWQLLAIEWSQAPEIPEKFVGEKCKIKKGVAINSQWLCLLSWGESHGFHLRKAKSECRTGGFHQHSKEAQPKSGRMEGELRAVSPAKPWSPFQPSCCISHHRAAGPGSTLGTQTRGWGQLSFFVPALAVPSQTQTPQSRPQPKAWPDIRGDRRGRQAWGQGTAAGTSTCAQ